ncbi:putative histone-like DNA-binding protein [Parabacteroides sp. PF5-5]|uniref:HU family DNA-binding protein n=1 Tax=unclassified Parabacteroides TaxID=2649774 RepID=UPI0024731818|nr:MULTISPECIES: HU family DNA-binding protein [unclassified Parabacteroides]MDH6303547.1 putative histone-like DNA-binding protein [Parabacteroides sp. PH5-39]MDH6314869.1 putative histone-like DNA-binding protein [Parabacteroides sp. PF5-13]MDH6318206.1 putative histone-like DNA-binding protein [Parabacteroides sp. PH5-13]MDH6321861.1 putative histone-like DNA-binding protein [Parabacteroides sp. PH5-8]MDH6325985.1 putative histone-like DNA-binding protein [Parabacteroides sp. PH5-41]
MEVKFSVYTTPKPKDRKGRASSHARLQAKGTKRINDICEYIRNASSMSPADVKGVLESLFQYVALQLEDGYNVEVENFGHFSVALRSRSVINNAGRKVGRVQIDGVNFRCSARLKEHLFHKARLQRVRKPAMPFPSLEDRKKRMVAYLEENGSINKSLYAQLNVCTRYCANNDIRSFVQEGLILPSGGGTHKVYLLTDGK